MNKRYWTATLTNLGYPAVGALTGNWLVFASHLLLGVGSAGYHFFQPHQDRLSRRLWRQHRGWKWQKADEIGMQVAFLSQIWYLLGADWWLAPFFLGIALFMGINHDRFDNLSVGLLAALALAVGMSTHWVAIVAFPIYMVALYLRNVVEKDARRLGEFVFAQRIHGLWHLLTQTAMMFTLTPYLIF